MIYVGFPIFDNFTFSFLKVGASEAIYIGEFPSVKIITFLLTIISSK